MVSLLPSNLSSSKPIIPNPGFCVKLTPIVPHAPLGSSDITVSAAIPTSCGKIFLNICTCAELPEPDGDMDEEMLAKLLETGPESFPGSPPFRIPISLGEAHEEFDNSGQPCQAYDCIVNVNFYNRRLEFSDLFRSYLIFIAIDALDHKYEVKVDRRNWSVLRNRKQMGRLKGQSIRCGKPVPIIEELPDGYSVVSSESTPRHHLKMIKPDATGDNPPLGSPPTQFSADIWLPKFCGSNFNADLLDVQMGEDRLRVRVSGLYLLDVGLPVRIWIDTVTSQFDVSEGKLSVIGEIIDDKTTG